MRARPCRCAIEQSFYIDPRSFQSIGQLRSDDTTEIYLGSRGVRHAADNHYNSGGRGGSGGGASLGASSLFPRLQFSRCTCKSIP